MFLCVCVAALQMRRKSLSFARLLHLLPLVFFVIFVLNYSTFRKLSKSTRAKPNKLLFSTGDQLVSSEELEKNYLVPKEVFYFWCGPKRNFEFRHYLSVRSVFTYLKPYRVTFFYENEPFYDDRSHDTWLKELGQQYPFFCTQPLSAGWCDNYKDNVEKYLAENGGIFVHEEIIIGAMFRDDLYRNFHRLTVIEESTETNLLKISSPQYNNDVSHTLCSTSDRQVNFVKTSWKLWDVEYIRKQTGTIQMTACNSTINKTLPINTENLIMVDTSLFPEQIWELDSQIGRQLRTVAYEKPDLARAVPNSKQLAPNIAHMIWTNNDTMGFHFYLCIASLLDAAKFDKVYLHGNGPPTGMYWDLIKDHPRLRLVKRTVIDGKHERIYGNWVSKRKAHVTDIIRLDILNRYGGLYIDTDAIFFRPLTQEIRAYDAVLAPDISSRDGFPDTLHNGIMLGKPGAKFWRLMLESNKLYFDDDWIWNSCVSTYKIKERYPNDVLTEPRLNTICHHGKCYPTWSRQLRSGTDQQIAEVMKNWRNSTYSIHHTWGDLPEFDNHEELLKNNGTSLFGEVGLYVLEQAGMLDYFKRLLIVEK